MAQPKDPGAVDHDIRCSNSCTRAALTALVLAAIAVSLLPLIKKTQALDALAQYIGLRIHLEQELEQLELDPAWAKLKSSEPAAATWTVGSLLKYNADLPIGREILVPYQERKTPKTESDQAALPSFQVTGKRRIEPIHNIAAALKKLADLNMVNAARQYSPQYDISIHGWRVLWYRLETEALSAPYSAEDLKTGAPEVVTLSVPQVVRLANYNFPTMPNYVVQSTVTIPSLGMPVGVVSAALFVELGLILLLLDLVPRGKDLQDVSSCRNALWCPFAVSIVSVHFLVTHCRSRRLTGGRVSRAAVRPRGL